MRTRHAREIRKGINDRILYDKAFRLGFDEKFLKGIMDRATQGKPKYRVSAFMRTIKRDGQVYTGNRYGQAFMNPSMRGHGLR